MHLDGFGLFVEDMPKMIRFYRDVLGFEIKEAETSGNVYLIKDDTLFMLYCPKYTFYKFMDLSSINDLVKLFINDFTSE